MKTLKCPDCGGQVSVTTSAEGHVLGSCAHCAAQFVIDAQGRRHIIVEHRFPDHRLAAAPAQPALGRRVILGMAGAVALGAVAALGFGRQRQAPAAEKGASAELLFNVGGEGAGAGQFRDHVFGIGIDSRGRAALIDNRDRVYVFGPEGEFITHYAQDESRKGRFCVLLPKGDLIFADGKIFHRLALESGALIESVATGRDLRGWNAAYALTAQGGIAVYSTQDHGLGRSGGEAPKDQITIFGPDLKEQRHLSGFLAQAIAPDPMVQQWPEVTAIAVDPAGSFYLNIRANEDNDLRGGIFEFNADGRLLRRIEVDQKWHGQLAISADKTLWYGDAWRNDLQRISGDGRSYLALSGLAKTADAALGNVAAFALYPNGDIALATMNHRFARLRPVAPKA